MRRDGLAQLWRSVLDRRGAVSALRIPAGRRRPRASSSPGERRPELRPVGEVFLNGAVWSQAYRGRGITVFRVLRPATAEELALVAGLSWEQRARLRMPADLGCPPAEAAM